jgi:hypothetical protein
MLFNPLFFLPLAVFFLLWQQTYRREPCQETKFRKSFLTASILWAAYTVLVTEVLSLFKEYSFWGVFAAWSFLLLLLVFLEAISINKSKGVLSFCLAPSQWGLNKENRAFVFLSLTMLTLLLGVTFMVAWFSVSNDSDSLAYHLPRINHWIQNRTLAPYATDDLRQLYLPAGAEMIIGLFQILTRGNLFTNLPQWFAYLGCMITVSLIARNLGASGRGQWMSAVLFAAIPVAILQSVNAKNSLIMSYYYLGVIYFAQDYLKTRKKSDLLMLGLVLGLGAATQVTVILFSIPWLLILLISQIRKAPVKCLGTAAWLLFCVFLFTAGHLSRLVALLGLPWQNNWKESLPIMYCLNNEMINYQTLISNFVRNLGLELGTPFEAWNKALFALVIKIHQWIHLSPMDPRITWADGEGPFSLKNFSFTGYSFSTLEISVQNTLHLFLCAGGIFSVALIAKFRKRPLIKHVLCILLAAVLFCLFVKYTIYHIRFHLLLFAAMMPLVGHILAAIRWQKISIAILLILFSLSWYYVLNNPLRPIHGRFSIFRQPRNFQYYHIAAPIYVEHLFAIDIIKKTGFKKIGIAARHAGFEYPFWVLLGDFGQSDYQIHYVHVSNISNKFESPNFMPEIVILVRDDRNTLEFMKAHSAVSFLAPYQQLAVFITKAGQNLRKAA